MAPARAAVSPDQAGTFSIGSSHTPDQLDICFDDTHAIASTGLLLAATLAERLSMEPCRTSRYGRHGSWPRSLVNPSGALPLQPAD